MLDSGYYIAVVKEEIETDAERTGRPKVKTVTYNYLVKAGSVAAASEKVQDYMESSMNTWRLHSVKEYKLTDIIE